LFASDEELYLIKITRNNENDVVVFSSKEYTHTLIETSEYTMEYDLISKKYQENRLEFFSSKKSSKFEGKSFNVAVILYKRKEQEESNGKIEKHDHDEGDSHNEGDATMKIYYGRNPSCEECLYTYYGKGTSNGLDIASVIFGLALLGYASLWLIWGFIILCKKSSIRISSNNKESEKADRKFENEEEGREYSRENIEFDQQKFGDFETRSFKSMENYKEEPDSPDEKVDNVYAFK
jgi:hypothetical protein